MTITKRLLRDMLLLLGTATTLLVGALDLKRPNTKTEQEKKHAPLEISPDHMVFVEGGRAVPAKSLKEGDKIIMEGGKLGTVKGIKQVTRKGAYAPFTPSGTIVVNGVLGSCYVAFQDSEFLKLGNLTTPITYQWLAHVSEGPHRVACRLGFCETETYTDEGMSTWVATPFYMLQWTLKQSSLLMAVLISLAIILLVPIWTVEQFPLTTMTCTLLLMLSWKNLKWDGRARS